MSHGKNVITERGAFDIRPATGGDLDYILSSWQLTWEESPEMNMPGMIRDEYFRHAHLILDELISRSSKKRGAYVCYQAGSPHIIRGYLISETYHDPDIAYLHWVQVKKSSWGQGVASALMERMKIDHRIHPQQNILYTFAAKTLLPRPPGHRLHGFAKAMQDKHNLIYWPWMKYTSQEPGWEAGA